MADTSDSLIVRGRLAMEEGAGTSDVSVSSRSSVSSGEPEDATPIPGNSEHAAAPAVLAVPTSGATHENIGIPSSGSPVPDTSFTWGGYFQAIGILILLLAALWFVLRLMRRFGGGRFLPAPSVLPRQALRVEAQLPLGQHKGVFVVRFLNKRLLLGVTDQRITLLTETDMPDDEENNDNFQRIMEATQRQGRGDPVRQPVDSSDASGAGSRGGGR